MSQTTIVFLETLGATVAVAILGFLANVTNLSGVLPPQYVPIVATIAGAFLAALSQSKSPTGTALFGKVGKLR